MVSKSKNKNNLVLLGFMGVGKTTVAKILSEKLELKKLDSDEEIEKSEGKSIREIFEKGEIFFRDLETKFLKEIQHFKNIVLSVGGGIIEREENIVLLQNIGLLYFLEIPLETLWQRVKQSKTRPKILQTEDEEKGFLEFKKLYQSRLSQYQKADFTISINKETAEQVANKIMTIYQK